MKNSKLWLPLIAALFVTAVPALSAAQPSAVYDTLAGTPLDPAATTVRVVPPRGGTVMVYQKGKVVGWWMRSGAAAVKPNQVYGILATRGSQLLFNQQVMVRPGTTELVWGDNNMPSVAYYPALGYRQPARRVYVNRNAARPNARPSARSNARRRAPHQARFNTRRRGNNYATSVYQRRRAQSAGRPGQRRPMANNTRAEAPVKNKVQARNAARVAPRRAISTNDYKRMLRAMDYADNDRARLTVLRSFARRFSFDKSQQTVILARFESAPQRSSAEQLLK